MTKKKLRKKISELEIKLEFEKNENRRSAFVEKTGLPPCKNIYCTSCKNAVFYSDDYGRFTVGCAKDVDCSSFEKIKDPADYSPERF